MKFSVVIAALLSAALVSGCVINVGKDGEYSEKWEKREKDNRNYISTLVLNTSEAEIRSRLGEPDFSEGYTESVNNSEPVRVLFYRTQRQKEDGITTKAECTPLVFKGGKLVGWGDKAHSLN